MTACLLGAFREQEAEYTQTSSIRTCLHPGACFILTQTRTKMAQDPSAWHTLLLTSSQREIITVQAWVNDFHRIMNADPLCWRWAGALMRGQTVFTHPPHKWWGTDVNFTSKCCQLLQKQSLVRPWCIIGDLIAPYVHCEATNFDIRCYCVAMFVLLQNNSLPLLTCRTCLGKKAIPGQGGSFFISITQIWRWRWWNVMIGEWEKGRCSNEIEPYKVPLSSSSWFRNDQKQVFLTRTWREKQKLCNLPRWKEQRRTDRGDRGSWTTVKDDEQDEQRGWQLQYVLLPFCCQARLMWKSWLRTC